MPRPNVRNRRAAHRAASAAQHANALARAEDPLRGSIIWRVACDAAMAYYYAQRKTAAPNNVEKRWQVGAIFAQKQEAV